MAPWPRSATTAAGCTPTPTFAPAPAARARSQHRAPRRLTDAELRRLAATAEAAPAVAPPPRTSLDTAALTVALQKYDGTAIDQQISRLAAVLPPLELLQDVFGGLLRAIGRRAVEGTLIVIGPE